MLRYITKLWKLLTKPGALKAYPPNFVVIAPVIEEAQPRYGVIWQGKSHWLYLSYRPAWPEVIRGAVNYTAIPGVEGFAWVQDARLQCEFEKHSEALRFVNECIPTLKRKLRVVPIYPRAKQPKKALDHAETTSEKDTESARGCEERETAVFGPRCTHCGKFSCTGTCSH